MTSTVIPPFALINKYCKVMLLTMYRFTARWCANVHCTMQTRVESVIISSYIHFSIIYMSNNSTINLLTAEVIDMASSAKSAKPYKQINKF